uniref:proline--tRNA ligase n=1 Tax=Setaria digitata TaxID=48799 RepID=A0A915PJ27_9BILA
MTGKTKGDALETEIASQESLVQMLKSDPSSPQEEKEAAIEKLEELKTNYKKLTGEEYGEGEMVKNVTVKESTTSNMKGRGDMKKQTKLGIEVTKAENYSEWYTEVITKAEMIEYYDVSGCYVLRPWAYAIWEFIQEWFDEKIKKLGVKNCYFPIFVSQGALEREKTHMTDFAPEVAWVTRAGQSDLAEAIAIRPTSETVMYPSYAKWVQSHRDLPIKLNQWCNVVRWEFKHPTPFLRTREFLWQEGHTAFQHKSEAEEEVFKILDLYTQVYTDLLAIPVIKGRKTEKEKFAGADFTTTVEAYVPINGRGIQGATSHHLGQNFSKMFNISFEDPSGGGKVYAWQNSWGLSTRTIGALVMIHGDDSGLVLPPRLAATQIIIIPVGVTNHSKDEGRAVVIEKAKVINDMLVDAGIRAEIDARDNISCGWKFNHWELKGVPMRIEIGPKDLANNQVICVIRYSGEKRVVSYADLTVKCKDMLDEIHHGMYNRILAARESHKKIVTAWNDFREFLDRKYILLAPFCGHIECEEEIRKESVRDDKNDAGAPAMGAKSLCIPLEQPDVALPDDCINKNCSEKPKFFALFGRSY